MLVELSQGKGKLPFPYSLRQTLFGTFVVCQSIQSSGNVGQTYYLTCNASSYKTYDGTFHPNILEAFTSTTNYHSFPARDAMSLNIMPEQITFFVNRLQDGKLEVDPTFSGNLRVMLYGYRKIKGNVWNNFSQSFHDSLEMSKRPIKHMQLRKKLIQEKPFLKRVSKTKSNHQLRVLINEANDQQIRVLQNLVISHFSSSPQIPISRPNFQRLKNSRKMGFF